MDHCTIPILTEEAFPIDSLHIILISACLLVFINYFDTKFLKFEIYIRMYVHVVVLSTLLSS